MQFGSTSPNDNAFGLSGPTRFELCAEAANQLLMSALPIQLG